MRRDRPRPSRCLRSDPGPLRSLGAWFGVLALLVQLIVAVLPIPSYAASPGAGGDLTRICSTHHAAPAGNESPQTPHRQGQCPLCTAVNLGANLLPPPPGNLIGAVRSNSVALRFLRFAGPAETAHYTPQQPRGPPATL